MATWDGALLKYQPSVLNIVAQVSAIVFDDQNDMVAAFQTGELQKDFIAVLRFQGPKANGMPELHKLTPPLGVLQDKGFKVALVLGQGNNDGCSSPRGLMAWTTFFATSVASGMSAVMIMSLALRLSAM